MRRTAKPQQSVLEDQAKRLESQKQFKAQALTTVRAQAKRIARLEHTLKNQNTEMESLRSKFLEAPLTNHQGSKVRKRVLQKMGTKTGEAEAGPKPPGVVKRPAGSGKTCKNFLRQVRHSARRHESVDIKVRRLESAVSTRISDLEDMWREREK